MKHFNLIIRHILPSVQIRQLAVAATVYVLALLLPGKLFAQAPAITYSTPQTFVDGTAISALSPVNTGGAAAALHFNSSSVTVSTGVNDANCVAIDKLGNMYIGESSGQVSVLSTGGSSATVLATGFTSSPILSIAVDQSGILYLADGQVVWKIPATGARTPVIIDRFDNPKSVAVDAAGHVYVADIHEADELDSNGGLIKNIGEADIRLIAADQNGNVFFYDADGNVFKRGAGNSNNTLLGSTSVAAITTDPSGNFYTVTNDGRLAIAPQNGGAVITIGSFPVMKGVAVDASFNIYGALNGNIIKVSADGGYFTNPELPFGLTIDATTGVISGTPSGTSSATDYKVTAFNSSGSNTATINITVNPVLPSLSYSSPQSYQVGTAISALSPASSRVASWGYGTGAASIGSGLFEPVDLASDAAGNVYVADVATNNIVKIPAGNGTPVTLAAFSTPFGIAVDAAGNVYVAAASAGVILEIPAGGGATNAIGSGFIAPSAVAVDGSGNVYVADAGNGALKEVPAGNPVGTGPITIQSGFNNIQGVAVDAAGNLYVADAGAGTSGNGAVYKMPAGGGPMISVGTGFSRPSGVAVDAAGNVYVADINKSVITVIEPDGTQFTIGSGFNSPNGVTVDGLGNVYIADSGNGKVKEVKINGGYFLSPFLPAGLTFNNNTGVISGTPTATAAAANYTVTAYNVTGPAQATINITVGVPVISYNSPVACATGVAITPLTPSVSGGTIAPLAFNANAITLATGLNDATCLAVGPDGSIYIGESSGQVSKLAAGAHSTTVLATGFSTLGFTEGIAVDASGNVYFADGLSVWKIPAGGGSATALGSFVGPTGVALDAAGNIYVAANSAPPNGGVYKIAPDGTGKTTIINTSQATATVDHNGNVFSADNASGDVNEVPVGGVVKNLHSFSQNIKGISTDLSGNVYALTRDSRITMLPANGSAAIQVLTGSGTTAGLAIDANFNVYTVDSGNILKVNAAGGYFTNPELPNGLAVDPNTGIISGTPAAASAAANYVVTAFNTYGSASATVNITAGPAPAISYSTPQTYTRGVAVTSLLPSGTGAAVSARGFNTTMATVSTGISDATCLTMDKAGNMYIGESSGKVSILAQGASIATVYATGFATPGAFSPEGIAVDASGNVYFADGTSLWKIPAGGGTPTTLGGFSAVNGVGLDAAGNIYAGGYAGGYGIFKMHADGSGQTKIGNADAIGLTADPNGNVFAYDVGSTVYEIPAGGVQKSLRSISDAWAITADASGNVYIAENSGQVKIDVFSADGSVQFDIGPNFPPTGAVGLFIDSNYNLYIAHGTISKVNPTGGYFISPELPQGLTINSTSGAISGTPAAVSPAANYTVTAFSNSVKATAPLNISVVSSNANLSNLTVNSGTLSPAFAVGTTNYTDTVSSATASVILTPTAADANATIKVNGVTVASGTPASVALSATTNIIPVVVTAQDGTTTKTYTLTVNRPSNNIKLSTFKVTPSAVLTIVPGPHYRDYEAIVYAPTSSIQVTAITQDATAAFTVNGMAGTSGVASAPIPLNTDTTTIYTTITAGDGVTRKTYAMKVTRLSSNNAKLTSFKLSPSAALTAVAGTDYKDYTATVRSTTSSISILAISQDAAATITVNGVPATSGTVSSPIHLNVDTNTIYTTVTAGDGVTKKTYAIVVTRPPSNNAVLATFTTTPKAALTAVPGTDYRDYEATVFNPASSISIIATPQDATATFTVNGLPGTSGTASAPINLNADTTTIYTSVTAGDGVTKKTYALKVTRQASNNALLTTFTTTPRAALTAVAGTDYRDYVAAVDNSTSSISIFAVVQNATSAITVNGVPATSGTASDPVHLNVDTNTIYTTVTAGDGVTKKTYAILITRAAPSGLVMKYEAPDETLVTGGEIVVHQNVSPNGDGRSDGLVIEGIAAHPDNRLQIMSRSGVLVYEAKGYDNATKVFDGHASTSGKLQQAGTYFYSLEYKVGKEIKHKTGFIVLKY